MVSIRLQLLRLPLSGAEITTSLPTYLPIYVCINKSYAYVYKKRHADGHHIDVPVLLVHQADNLFYEVMHGVIPTGLNSEVRVLSSFNVAAS